eukprot:gene29077-32285_t
MAPMTNCYDPSQCRDPPTRIAVKHEPPVNHQPRLPRATCDPPTRIDVNHRTTCGPPTRINVNHRATCDPPTRIDVNRRTTGSPNAAAIYPALGLRLEIQAPQAEVGRATPQPPLLDSLLQTSLL